MLWLTWRQHRLQVLVTAVALLGAGTFLLVHGLRTAELAAGLAPAELERLLAQRFRPVDQALSWLPWAPLLIGLFWGAPVVAREFERGTYQVAWTQSVTRLRWLAVKLGVLGVLAALAGLALGAMLDAWLGVFAGTRFADRFANQTVFGSTGVASAAWWLFAFTLGAASGAMLRRLIPAMVVTVTVFLVVVLGVIGFARDGYAAPVRVAAEEVPADAMVVRHVWVSAGAEPPERMVDLHPPNRYWRFQWTEAGLLAAGTALLAAGAGYHLVRRERPGRSRRR